ncbi:BON domain-containing protein [candidate division KSB3 bacterium]|uniref:BON domain-containing protein n=1 Tax=candidate division KSB3 bacterium TaxID=2044937 RepID=A0A9D5JXR9_9BACT|nr:BON domain-containing protein [candidate division KSB3 bacterium]MBD3325911.1 BON domain-containing protein [candidate division KSB3 bacterium]
MAIITISRQFGSLGTIIAKQMNQELKYDYLDKLKLENILVSEYGIPEENIERYDERKPAFWDIFSSNKDKYLHFLKTVLYDFASHGDCMIIGRGGEVLLKDVPGILHVRVIAPTELRIARVKERYSYSDHLAEKIVRRSDHDRIGFHKFFFHVNWEDPSLYDLVINTGIFSVEMAVELIKKSLDLLGLEAQQDAAKRKLSDLCLGQKIMTQIAYEERVPIQFLETHVEHGIATLRGSTITSEDIDRCERIARQIPGVKDVVNEVYFIPNTYGMT